MPELLLLFQLYGPLVSWGEVAVGEARPTAGHPSKSAVLGLIAAALGVLREDAAAHCALATDLGYAVRLDLPGALLQDYHTVQIPGTRQARRAPTRPDELAHAQVGTLLSTRGYRTDALATVCLWVRIGSPRWPLDDLRVRLEQPQFVPYLGRKACPPALPLAPRIVTAATLRDAFTAYDAEPFQAIRIGLLGKRAAARLFTDADGPPHGYEGAESQTLRTVRRDVPADRLRWLFSEREEVQIILSQPA